MRCASECFAQGAACSRHDVAPQHRLLPVREQKCSGPDVVQVTFSLNAAIKVPEVSQASAPSQSEPGSFQPRHVKEETRKVLARPILHDADSQQQQQQQDALSDMSIWQAGPGASSVSGRAEIGHTARAGGGHQVAIISAACVLGARTQAQTPLYR